ncbi:MAG: Hsp20/alpha crystallin family protein [Thermodesulfovibrionales bacterium]|nr:Hsp20/alpha crystallin family protein [Thermodesulfovibrionales bacterium]
MSIVKWSPLKELEEMRRDMDRLFEDFFAPVSRRRRWIRPEAGVVVPNVEMYDRKNDIVLKAELPGISKEDIDLTITKDSLTLKGEIRKEEEVKEEDYYAAERSYGSFTRTIAMPVEVDAGKAKASFKNGVLEIVLPKKEEAKPKEIKIEVS